MTLLTHNLAIGVVIGIALSTILFSRKIAQLVFVDTILSPDQQERIYSVAGQLFFVSVDEFLAAFNFKEELQHVKINLTHAHIWDQAAVAAIDKVVLKFQRNSTEVELVGLNEASARLLEKLANHNKLGALESLEMH